MQGKEAAVAWALMRVEWLELARGWWGGHLWVHRERCIHPDGRPPHVMGRLWQKNLHDGLLVGWWEQGRLGWSRDEGGQEGLGNGRRESVAGDGADDEVFVGEGVRVT